jgi:hypothetical protein
MEVKELTEICSKTMLICDSCKTTISLPDKGKSKENEQKKKQEPTPLSAILDYGADGIESKEFLFCDVLCLKNYLNDKYPNSKKKKSKASIDCDIKLFNRW